MPLTSISEPDVVTAAVAVPVLRKLGLVLCGTAHGGVGRVALGDDEATTLAGGLGLRLAAPIGLGSLAATPFAELRGLAAQTTGTDLEVDASGLSLGGAFGVQVRVGPITLRLAGAIDGFDEGLGATPYPNRSVEAVAGFRF